MVWYDGWCSNAIYSENVIFNSGTNKYCVTVRTVDEQRVCNICMIIYINSGSV